MKRYWLLFAAFMLAATVFAVGIGLAARRQERIIRLHVVFTNIDTGAITGDAYISAIEGNSIHVTHGDEKIEITPKVVK